MVKLVRRMEKTNGVNCFAMVNLLWVFQQRCDVEVDCFVEMHLIFAL